MTDEDSLLDKAIDELYAADLDQFTPRRTELTKEARAAGAKDAAKAITALRKPTQSAFTINRLARTDPSAITGLIDVGDEMRRAQRSADGKQLRELNTQRRKLLDGLVKRAFEIIGQQSPSSGQREEVNATLMAALADPAVAEQLRQGILVRAAESSGFGFSPPELTLIRSQTKHPAADAPPPAKPEPAPKLPTDDAEPAAAEPRAAEPAKRSAAEKATEKAAEKAAEKATDEAVARRDKVKADRDRRDAAQVKVVTKAQVKAEEADSAVHEAVAAIDASQQLIKLLQHQLTDARRSLEENQKKAKLAEARQRKAREALNKAKG